MYMCLYVLLKISQSNKFNKLLTFNKKKNLRTKIFSTQDNI